MHFGFQLSRGIHPLRVVERDFLVRILYGFHHLLHAVDFKRAGLIVKCGDQILRRAEVLASRHQHGVLHRVDDDLRIDALLFAQNLNGLIDASHCFLFSNCLGVNYQSNFRLAFSTCASGKWITLPVLGSNAATSRAMTPCEIPASLPSQRRWFSTGSRSTTFAFCPTNLSKSFALDNLRSRPGELTSSV